MNWGGAQFIQDGMQFHVSDKCLQRSVYCVFQLDRIEGSEALVNWNLDFFTNTVYTNTIYDTYAGIVLYCWTLRFEPNGSTCGYWRGGSNAISSR